MGAWGTGPLQDDTVQDWLGTFGESPSETAIVDALQHAEAESWLDDLAAAGVIGSCAVMSAMAGRVPDGLPDEVASWAGSRESPSPELVAKAMTALDKVRSSSEYQEMWEDSGDAEFEEWANGLTALQAGLPR